MCREGRINDYRMAAMSERRHPVWLLMKRWQNVRASQTGHNGFADR